MSDGFCVVADQRPRSYVRPSAVLKATNAVEKVLRSTRSRENSRRLVLSTAPSRSFKYKEDPNIVIAAYGTQITLHRAKSSQAVRDIAKGSKHDLPLRGSRRPNSVSTAFEQRRVESKSGIIDVMISPKSLNATSSTNLNNSEMELNPKSRLKSPPSDCSSEDFIDRTSIKKPLGLSDKLNSDILLRNGVKQRFRRTAWDISPIKEVATSIASFVDLKDIAISVPVHTSEDPSTNKEVSGVESGKESFMPDEASPLHRYPESSAHLAASSTTENVNNYGNILHYHFAPRSQSSTGKKCQYENNKIREIWGTRNKNDLSLRMEFQHEILRRPKSAYQFCTSIQSKNDSKRKDDLIESKVPKNPSRKWIKRRRATSASHPQRNLLTGENVRLQTSTVEPCAMMDTKSLIRQSHRPTIAIRYLQSDKRTIPSITPCVRKAKVSHEAYVSMHNRAPDISQSPVPSAAVKKPINLSVTVSSISQLQNDDNGLQAEKSSAALEDKDKKSSPDLRKTKTDIHKEIYNQENSPCPNQKIESDCSDKGVKAIKTSQQNCDPIELQSENLDSSKHRSEKVKTKSTQSHIVEEQQRKRKIRPLSAEYVRQLDSNSQMNEEVVLNQKNRMIRMWLDDVKTPQTETLHDEKVNDS